MAFLPVSAVDFESEIEPIFETHCFDCHGEDKQKGAFRLDRLSSLLKGGDSAEPAVVPRNPAESFLVKAIKHKEPKYEMPPKGAPLSETEIALIEKWIAEGAKTPERYGPAEEKIELKHWSFQPVQRPETAENIDGFIDRKLTENGLSPSPEADRRTLIRRLYLVMLGLPPTPEQVDAFLADQRPDAWIRLVEQTLASPHYGEKWATHWLDLARFGETHGFEMNRERPTAWPWRDWVIAAFNDDKPYDQFVREQIAGDSLGVDIGTGFLVAGPKDQVGGQDPKLRQMQRMNELDDIINTTGTAFLGLTTGCARCHNHKFDPISQTDYYAMQAVFAGVNHGDREVPFDKEVEAEKVQMEKKITRLREELKNYQTPDRYSSIVIDELEATHHFEPAGQAAKTGATTESIGGEKYTWWKNRPGKEMITYSTKVTGSYRVWLSWGAGYESHSGDASYAIRSVDGSTKEITRVNQSLPADGKAEKRKPLASGFYDAGIHTFLPGDTISLIGGKHGTAVTADAIVLEPAHESLNKPAKRSPVTPRHNEESFPPREAKFVRFYIESKTQACIDELEIFSGETNVALASAGSVGTSSGDFVHPSHKLAHINDGKFGNQNSWIVKANDGTGWVQIELPQTTSINRIVWARDRNQKYTDRLATEYRIEIATEPGKWSLLADHKDRLTSGNTEGKISYDFSGLSAEEAEKAKAALAEIAASEKRIEAIKESAKVYAGKFSQPGPTHRLYRGEPEMKREQVGPNAIAVFASLNLDQNAPDKQRRLAFANWVADPANPLTARVIVNRLWQFHFGTGIVDTPSDLGRNGTAPTHPELLDWLASELIKSGWSLKHMHRLILQSATWKQSNTPREEAMKIDAASRLLWRFPPRRLEAEGIRDSILCATGKIDLEKRGGPGFDPFKVEAENVRHYHPKEIYTSEDWRRMIYMTKVRQEREQVFGAFDCPDASQAVAKRSRSTTPLQALNLLNSSFVMQQAALFVERLEKEAPDNQKQQIERAWQLCFQRPVTPSEIDDSKAFIEAEGMEQFCRAMLNMNEFVFIP